MKFLIPALVVSLVNIAPALSSPCEKEDFVKYVSSKTGCIGIEQLSDTLSIRKPKLLIYLHGDTGQETAGVTLSKTAKTIPNHEVNAFLIARPGWTTPAGNKSEGGDPEGVDNGDNYIPTRDIDPVADAVEALKEHYQPDKLILVGHSGGSAIAGVLIGRYPQLIDVAVLGACPCIVPPWREHRMQQKFDITPSGKNWWSNSHSPHDYVAKIDQQTKVVLIVGTNDTNTLAEYSEAYLALLKGRGIDASLTYIKDATHSGIRENKHYIKLLENIQSETP